MSTPFKNVKKVNDLIEKELQSVFKGSIPRTLLDRLVLKIDAIYSENTTKEKE